MVLAVLSQSLKTLHASACSLGSQSVYYENKVELSLLGWRDMCPSNLLAM